MAKLCKGAKKQLEKDPEKYVAKVRGGEHVCTRCGRVAVKKKHLCDPATMKDKAK